MNTIFLGRGPQLAEFSRTLDQFFDLRKQPSIPPVVLIHGQGGIGKSSLLHAFGELARKHPDGDFEMIDVDWQVERQQNPQWFALEPSLIELRAVLQAVNRRAEACVRKWNAEKNEFARTLGELDRTLALASREANRFHHLSKARDHSPVPEAVVDGAAETLGGVTSTLLGPVGSVLEPIITVLMKVGINATPKLATFVAEKLNKTQYELLVGADQHLARALATALHDVAEKRRVLVMFDTYEIVDSIDPLVRLVIKAAGPNVLWVIAGRRDLYETTTDAVFGRVDGYREEDRHEYEITQLNLRALAREDIREYFRKAAPDRRELTDDEVYRIDVATSAIPLAVKLAADIWRETGAVEDIITSDDLTEENIIDHMVGRYQQHCVYREEDRRTLWAIAMADGDPKILKAMLLPNFDNDEIYRKHLAFVVHRYEAVQRKNTREPRLHDEPARFFVDYLRSETMRTNEWVQRFNERAVQWLCGRIERLADYHPTLHDLCNDEDYIESVLKVANHLFWIEEDEAWPWVTARYVEGIPYSTPLREGLVEIALSWHPYVSARGRARASKFQRAERYPFKPVEQDARSELLEQDRGRGWLNDSRIQNRYSQERAAIVFWTTIESLRRASRYNEALAKAFSIASRLEASSPHIRAKAASTMLSLSLELDHENNRAEIRDVLQLAIRLDPDNFYVWGEFGAWLLGVQRLDEAEAHLKKAIDLAPQDATNYELLSLCHSNQKRHGEALATALRAVELQPKEARLWRRLGTAHLELGQYGDAIRCQQQAVQLSPSEAESWRCLGNAFSWNNEYVEAIRCFRKGLEFETTVGLLRPIAWCFFMLNDFESSESYFLSVIELDSEDPDARNGLACVWMMRGQNQKAASEFERALRQKESDASTYHLWGRMLYRVGDYEGAWDKCEQAARLQPDNLKARAALEGLALLVDRGLPADLAMDDSSDLAEIRDPLNHAEWLALKGERERAIEVIAESVNHTPNNALYMNYCPAFHLLRNDPRLQSILTLTLAPDQ